MGDEMRLSGTVKDLYPSERNAVLSVKHQLMSELAYRKAGVTFTEDMMKRRFEEQAKERCAEIGFLVEVNWQWDDPETGEFSPTVSDNEDDNNIYWLPQLQIVDRIAKLTEIDHDRMRHEVVTGEADGRQGYMREDGTKSEEPLKKDIY